MYMALMKKRKGVLIYESKNSHELHAEPVVMGEREQKFIDDAFEWMRTVYQAYEDNQLPKKPYRSNSKVCKRCPLAAQCAEAGVGDVKIAPMVGLSD
jgi:CRISPR/Cas system-associated exonuclease Cas4 (RecB family)